MRDRRLTWSWARLAVLTALVGLAAAGCGSASTAARSSPSKDSGAVWRYRRYPKAMTLLMPIGRPRISSGACSGW